MKCPIEQPDPSVLPHGEARLLVGGLWGSVMPTEPRPWVEWEAELDGGHADPCVVLGRD